MGTRGTVHVIDGKKTVASVYFQYDSYPSGLGDELQAAFGDCTVVNGYSSGTKGPLHANGMGCLAAQLVAKFKDGVGNVYMTDRLDRQEYNYFISESDGRLQLKLTTESGRVLYKGPLSAAPMGELEQ